MVTQPRSHDDPHDLDRFVRAQEGGVYRQALSEIRAGEKRSHWMWFVFPQFRGLGASEMSRRYAIGSLAEARAYLAHPILGPRLRECSEAAVALAGRSMLEVFGSPDDAKLRSSATLFEAASPPGSIFARLLDQCFARERDQRTRELIEDESRGE